ncbi:MAG TPA: rRNA pseudouridine synthase [Bdellovibrionales bacterium]|nr:pseudouridylate synthase [Pseudobdellovibrionaceae bacterium]HAG91292.1 rRNA pseudouridine synthase [Bdellovibrionales bacterium]|tara:strand:+ start:2588 stop:3502 length:915 start_codon:yes stop_codon:yes gene_type:complete
MAKQNLIRLNKYLADSGLASRRKADGMIEEGIVQVNGKTVFELGLKVDPAVDRVTVRGKPVKQEQQKIYIIFNKPESVVTSMDDPMGRPKVTDFIKGLRHRVFPVGRLDWDTEGLLLLTNDGDFSQRVTHPKGEIAKTYMVKLDGKPTDQQLQKLLKGVTIPGGKVAAKHVERAKVGSSANYDWVKIVITEGKNRQVRYMFQKIGYDVKKLKRTAIGQLTLGPLKKGEYAFLDEGGIRKVFKPSKLIIFREKEKNERKDPNSKRSKAKAAGSRGTGTKRTNSRGGSGKASSSRPSGKRKSRYSR